MNLIAQWKSELLNFSDDIIQEEDICVIKKGTDTLRGQKICIIPYSIIDKIVEQRKILPEQFGIVIADESHNIKSVDAKRTHCVLPFLRKSGVSICMTGTPALNRPVELYTQLNGLLPQVFNSYDQFVRRYCNAKPSTFDPNVLDVKGSSNESELKLLLENMVMIRRLKINVVENLPIKARETRYVNSDPKFASDINRIQKRSIFLDNKIKESNSSDKKKFFQEKEQLLTEYYQVTGLSKINAIKDEVIHEINQARINRALEISIQESTQNNNDSIDCFQNIASINEPPLSDSVFLALDIEDDFIAKSGSFSPKIPKNLISDDLEDNLVDSDEEFHDNSFLGKRVLKRKNLLQNEENFSTEKEKIDITSPNKKSKSTNTIGMKILVFAHHQSVLDAIEDALKEVDVGYIRVDGKTSSTKKVSSLNSFNNDSSVINF